MWKQLIFMPLPPLPPPPPLPFRSSNTSSYPTHQNWSGQSPPHPYQETGPYNYTATWIPCGICTCSCSPLSPILPLHNIRHSGTDSGRRLSPSFRNFYLFEKIRRNKIRICFWFIHTLKKAGHTAVLVDRLVRVGRGNYVGTRPGTLAGSATLEKRQFGKCDGLSNRRTNQNSGF